MKKYVETYKQTKKQPFAKLNDKYLFCSVPEGPVEWKPFDLTSKYYLDIDTITTLKKDLRPEVMNFWLKDIPSIELDPVDDRKVHDEL